MVATVFAPTRSPIWTTGIGVRGRETIVLAPVARKCSRSTRAVHKPCWAEKKSGVPFFRTGFGRLASLGVPMKDTTNDSLRLPEVPNARLVTATRVPTPYPAGLKEIAFPASSKPSSADGVLLGN